MIDLLRGINIIESPLAVTTEPARVHKRRRGQSESYHSRVQKKWMKRFGVVAKPAAYFIGGQAFMLAGMGGAHAVCLHPELAVVLRGLGRD